MSHRCFPSRSHNAQQLMRLPLGLPHPYHSNGQCYIHPPMLSLDFRFSLLTINNILGISTLFFLLLKYKAPGSNSPWHVPDCFLISQKKKSTLNFLGVAIFDTWERRAFWDPFQHSAIFDPSFLLWWLSWIWLTLLISTFPQIWSNY